MTMWCRHCGHSVPSGIDYEPWMSGYREVGRYPGAAAPCPGCGKDAAWSTYPPATSTADINARATRHLVESARRVVAEWDRQTHPDPNVPPPLPSDLQRAMRELRVNLDAFDAGVYVDTTGEEGAS